MHRNYPAHLHRSTDYAHSMDWNWNAALMPYGSIWRSRRRALHQALHGGVASEHVPAQMKHINRLLIKLLESPDLVLEHIKQCVVLTTDDLRNFSLRVKSNNRNIHVHCL